MSLINVSLHSVRKNVLNLRRCNNETKQSIDNRITILKSKFKNNSANNVSLKKHHINHSLKQFHDQFVMTPIDKDNENVAFIFKCFT